ncbi:P-type conjugative transfer protein VirB9 [Salmonella enterica]|nr:P-type conjugative transfer protein VirB9 [Salmonella enterica subsp. enterica serovar Mbandaka]EEJ1220008.1 P-type conjugative transfer protein VirB9 [Salmonella enterica]ELK3355970.1 TrbG/VirB9 family P-type conjugative transfer protein [Salmonella enterica]
MKFKKLYLVCLLFISPLSSYALDVPVGSSYDSRIKTVMYNAEDVTKVDSVIGVATHIILDPNETYLTHAFGDSDAWTFSYKKNHYFIKPKAENGDTNLTIVTDKRVYNFDIRYHFEEYLKGSKGKRTFDNKMTFQIQFKYPEVEAKKRKDADDEVQRKNEFKKLLAKGVNLKYSINGEKKLAPMNVWDTQGFTYFKFAPGQDIPTISAVDSLGNESKVIKHQEGLNSEIVVVHRISREFRLRLGTSVAGVYNENDGRQPVFENYTGTVSDKYKRVIINEQ